jgi:hypothetical protein
MRTTVRIDDALLGELKERSRREGVSLTTLVNRVLRRGMELPEEGSGRSRPYREETFSMGEPSVNLDKGLALAASLEEEEVRTKLVRWK